MRCLRKNRSKSVLSVLRRSGFFRPGALVLFFSVLAAWLLLSAQGQPQQEQETATSRFSHLTHARLRQRCTNCHPAAGDRAGFPSLEACRVCHTKFTEAQATFPTQRIFHLPDFVYFSHKQHVEAGAECGKCHSNINASHTVRQEPMPTMKFCMDCHSETNAPIKCFTCHDEGQ
jgi:hypothetical protein